ncbi:MAG: FkbM family methyltransferase [Caldilineaceae bacterium]
MKTKLISLLRQTWNFIPEKIRIPIRSIFELIVKYFIGSYSTVVIARSSFQVPHSNNSEFWNIHLAAQHEPETLSQFITCLDSLPQPITIYDIGANYGFYSLVAASYSQTQHKHIMIFAFEPDSQNYERLVRGISLNSFDNIKPLQLAVANKTTGTQRILPLFGSGENATLGYTDIENQDLNYQSCKVLAIDDLVEQKEILPPTLVKMDIEGYELEALYGMTTVLTQYKPQLLLEIHSEYLQRLGASPDELFTYMSKFGYKWIHLHPKGKGASYGHKQEHVFFF